MKALDLIWKLWLSYKANTPSAEVIQNLLSIQKDDYFNDHIAFRTINSSSLKKERIAKIFLQYGWEIKGSYHFEEKHLNAIHMEHSSNIKLPKIFISELILEKVSVSTEKILSVAFEVYEQHAKNENFLSIGRKHSINYSDYQKLLNESEYASWLYIFGIQPNHFTVYLNNYPKLSIEEFAQSLQDKNIALNTFGGIIKGSKEKGLKQASTMADKKYIKFADQDLEIEIPSCYVEFAERFNINGTLFNGFITNSADKIFESTKT